jgi:NAD(P)-dependent dehydrogenase (short-subunit alcohol dehydrogenase family)
MPFTYAGAMGKLDGKVAVVTGAARGVGRGEAMLLAAEGASVVVNDLGAERDGQGSTSAPAQAVVDDIVAAGGQAVANGDDIADWAGGRRLIEQALDTYGRLDILVCNAGILRDRMIFSLEEDDWDAVMRVHLKGHFVPLRHACAHWRQLAKSRGEPVGGRIVLTASTSGLYGNPGQANYGAAKSGIAGMSIIVAREMARYGVTCNAICPRARTRMTEEIFPEPTDGSFDVYHPDNVAPWVAYLATDDAAHISGQTFLLWGGTVELLQPWIAVNEIKKDGRWTVEELAKASIDLFAGRSTDPPPIPKVELRRERQAN